MGKMIKKLKSVMADKDRMFTAVVVVSMVYAFGSLGIILHLHPFLWAVSSVFDWSESLLVSLGA